MAIRYTRREEQLNAWSHGAGIVLAAGVAVWWSVCGVWHRDAYTVWGILLFLVGILFSYGASTLYHSTSFRSRWREMLRRLDHAAIYWSIAGSYSPITLIALRTEAGWGWGLFLFIWISAISGTIVSFFHLREHSHIETLCYVGMGLSVLVAFKPLMETVSAATIAWIVAEGVAYITGAFFYSFNKRRYNHTVFHFFVLLGTFCHVLAVWEILGIP